MSTGRHWTADGRIKVDRARKHFRDLAHEWTNFTQKTPPVFARFVEKDEDTGDTLIGIRANEEIPAHWSAMIGDILHNLRSGLNILWRATDPKRGNRPDEFPMHATVAGFEARFRANMSARRKAALDVLRVVKPYRGGNDAVWALHDLNNADKHQLIVPVACVVFEVTRRELDIRSIVPQVDGTTLRMPVPIVRPVARAMSTPIVLGKETVVERIPAEHLGRVDLHPEFSMTFTFGEASPLSGMPIGYNLENFLDVTQWILHEFSLIS